MEERRLVLTHKTKSVCFKPVDASKVIGKSILLILLWFTKRQYRIHNSKSKERFKDKSKEIHLKLSGKSLCICRKRVRQEWIFGGIPANTRKQW